jgi:heme/copper-type cytochrome/quinol oxidase subunit 3
MWLLILADAMGFIGFMAAYIVVRAGDGYGWPPLDIQPELGIPLTSVMTFLLILTSVTMVTALTKITKGDVPGLRKWLLFTIIGGAMFLGLQVYEWQHLIHAGMSPAVHNYGAFFFLLTGYHGLHVLSGVIYLTCVWVAAGKGRYTAENHSPVELVGLFWHFVDLVWIILFTILYLF